MSKEKFPVTPAIRFLRERKVAFTEHLYAYEERGGTAVSSRELGVDEHAVIKTLVMEDDAGKPLIILMHGDREVSTRELARVLGARSIRSCTPEAANRHTGYLVGGTSPFGTKKSLPVCMEQGILALEKIYLNGGKRGFLVGIAPKIVQELLGAKLVEVAINKC
jgi:Cys-tRNA(Pro) deacylase